MKLACFSRMRMEYYIQGHPDEKMAIVSITGKTHYTPHPRFRQYPNVLSFLNVEFDDVDSGHTAAPEQIEEIAQFIQNAIKLPIDSLYVHCDAGISRSAGAIAAIGKWLNGDDDFIFGSTLYYPNMFVYRHLMEALINLSQHENTALVV